MKMYERLKSNMVFLDEISGLTDLPEKAFKVNKTLKNLSLKIKDVKLSSRLGAKLNHNLLTKMIRKQMSVHEKK